MIWIKLNPSNLMVFKNIDFKLKTSCHLLYQTKLSEETNLKSVLKTLSKTIKVVLNIIFGMNLLSIISLRNFKHN